MLLLNPGPVTLTEYVRNSLLQPDLCHRESEFFDLQDEIKKRILAIYELDPAQWAAILITGSGTAAVESMLAGLVPETGRLLIVENGVYGERIAQISAQYGIMYKRIVGDWMQGLNLDVITSELDSTLKDQRFSHLAVVHHETTTGRLNDLPSLSKLCCERGVKLLVDAVSSFGAEQLNFSDESLIGIAATANKCLHAVPGVSFVVVRRTAICQATSRTYYLDLKRLIHLQDQRDTPFTPAIHAYYSLAAALCELKEQGGRRTRYQNYSALSEQVLIGMKALGIEPVVPISQSSVVLRAYHLPTGLTYAKLHDALKAEGFVIYAGQRDLSKTLFRISTMGDLNSADIDRLLKGVAKVINELKIY